MGKTTNNRNIITGTLSDIGEEFAKLFREHEAAKRTGWGTVSTILDNYLQSALGLIKPFSEVQKSAIELAKAVGMSSKGIMGTATRLIDQNRKMELSRSYGISNAEIMGIQASIFSKLGRNVAIDQVGTVQRNANGEIVNENFDSEIENLIAGAKAFGPEAITDMVAGFDKIGKSMKSATKMAGKMFQEAGKYGINLEKYTANFVQNLDMAQTYNFRNGVNGLKEMARKATEIRQDMKQIASFANKVGSVTGAVETAASLQVLGGSFAAMSNPLAMLNESLTDMEGLQERFNQMTAGLAKYDPTTHQIIIDSAERIKAQRAAEAMGVSYENMVEQAMAQARQTEIERQMAGMFNLTDEFKQLVVNAGQIDSETGEAGVTISGKTWSLSELSSLSADQQEELQKQLIEETRSESDDIKAIAKSVMGIEDIMLGGHYQIENAQAKNALRETALGPSIYDQTLEFVRTLSKESIEGAANLDQAIKSYTDYWQLLKGRAMSAGMEPLTATNPTEFGEAMANSFVKIFGDSNIAKELSNVLKGVSTAMANWVTKADEYMQEFGNHPLVSWQDGNSRTGQAGREITTTANNAAAAMVAKSAAATEAAIAVEKAAENTTFKPLTNVGELNRATVTFTIPQEIADAFTMSLQKPEALAGATISGVMATQPTGIQKTGTAQSQQEAYQNLVDELDNRLKAAASVTTVAQPTVTQGEGTVISKETIEQLLNAFGYRKALEGIATGTQTTGTEGVSKAEQPQNAAEQLLSTLGYTVTSKPITATPQQKTGATTEAAPQWDIQSLLEAMLADRTVYNPNTTADKTGEQTQFSNIQDLPDELIELLSKMNYSPLVPFAAGGMANFELTGIAKVNGVDNTQAQIIPDLDKIVGQFLDEFRHQVSTPLAPAQDNGPVKITTSDNSIPQTTVAPTTNKPQVQTQVTGQEAGTNLQGGTINLNVTGTLTMNVNGDNGKIGTADIMKMIQDNDGFRREIAKALAESLQKMQQSGQILNQ